MDAIDPFVVLSVMLSTIGAGSFILLIVLRSLLATEVGKVERLVALGRKRYALCRTHMLVDGDGRRYGR